MYSFGDGRGRGHEAVVAVPSKARMNSRKVLVPPKPRRIAASSRLRRREAARVELPVADGLVVGEVDAGRRASSIVRMNLTGRSEQLRGVADELLAHAERQTISPRPPAELGQDEADGLELDERLAEAEAAKIARRPPRTAHRRCRAGAA
jgi:hypothetical protein